LPSIPIILTTERSSEALAVEALRAGVQDYFAAGVAPETMLASVKRITQASDARGVPGKPELPVQAEHGPGEMIGESAPMWEMKRYMEKAAASNCTVLITGETGTGKELVAEFIHARSQRGKRPFVCVNCAAIPESLFESELFGHTKGAFTGAENMREGLLTAADGGTIFLDEIGDMSLFAQAKILRVLEKKEVCRLGGTATKRLDIRFVAATNQDLGAMESRGTFRKDLFFRLNVARVHVPSLRDRREDIPLLAEYFRSCFASDGCGRTPEFSEECLRCLLRYEWPGNIRELKNVIEGLFLGETPLQIGMAQLPPQLRIAPTQSDKLGTDEKEQLLTALFSANWNKSAAADKLHWSRMTLYRKIAKYKLSKQAPAGRLKSRGGGDEAV
jgi:DNA-binding NtrC family response regulator